MFEHKVYDTKRLYAYVYYKEWCRMDDEQQSLGKAVSAHTSTYILHNVMSAQSVVTLKVWS